MSNPEFFERWADSVLGKRYGDYYAVRVMIEDQQVFAGNILWCVTLEHVEHKLLRWDAEMSVLDEKILTCVFPVSVCCEYHYVSDFYMAMDCRCGENLYGSSRHPIYYDSLEGKWAYLTKGQWDSSEIDENFTTMFGYDGLLDSNDLAYAVSELHATVDAPWHHAVPEELAQFTETLRLQKRLEDK